MLVEYHRYAFMEGILPRTIFPGFDYHRNAYPISEHTAVDE